MATLCLLEQREDPHFSAANPQSSRQTELHRGGRKRHRGTTIPQQAGNALGGTEIGLMDDARLAVDALSSLLRRGPLRSPNLAHLDGGTLAS